MFHKTLAFCTIGATFLALSTAFAHDGATGVIKERMDLMKIIGKNTKMIAPMATGGADLDLKAVGASAAAISEAAKQAASKFPEGSLSEQSEAKPNIWTDWEKFSGLIESLAADSAALATAASNGDDAAILPAFGKMTGNCKTCHTEFRQKKK